MTVHNEAKKEDIAKIVLMAGDPERVKMIAEKYLEDKRLVNSVRGMYAYTGTYKGTSITVMAHGMGMPSAGIYAYELYKFYEVEKIIRLGTCGTNNKHVNLLDIILVNSSYTLSNYALTFNNLDIHIIDSSNNLNNIIMDKSFEMKIPVTLGNVLTSDCFDWYIQNPNEFNERLPKNFNFMGIEMESFAIFYIAKVLHKEAACLLTVVDSHFDDDKLEKEDINKKIDDMTIIALESIV